jgi:hypothetical protein
VEVVLCLTQTQKSGGNIILDTKSGGGRRGRKFTPYWGSKLYICPRFPYLRLAGACFDSGFLITSDVAVQAHVEAHPEFGKFIFPLAMDLTCTPREEEEDEEIY